jgi:FtsZ-interacting cell division protein ZipA
MEIFKMSDLQISLIIIGVIIIVGVVVFNWIQQVRYRRKVEEAFKQKHEDVLFRTNKTTKQNDRIEPEFDNRDLSEAESDLNDPVTDPETTEEIDHINKVPVAEPPDSKTNENPNIINYVASIRSDTPISETHLTELLQQKFDFGKAVRWFGQRENNQQWEEFTTETDQYGNGYVNLKGYLQLVDRSGPVTEVNLSNFRDLVHDFANHINSDADCPDIVTAHEHAILLDKFCADVDVVIGINIISKDHGAFIGTKIRALAEASGFKLDPEGIFKYRDENDNVLFTLNNHENEPFRAENMKSLTTHGITLLLDVPRVTNGEKAFDQMTHIARIFTNTLGGIMVDDNRVPLTDNGIIRSRQQLSKIQSVMKANNIPAGSANAIKLFV